MTAPIGGSSPEGNSGGAVYVDVLPDFKGFAPRFMARIRRLSRSEKVVVPATIDPEHFAKETGRRLRGNRSHFVKVGEEIGDQLSKGASRGFRKFFLDSAWKKRADSSLATFGKRFGTSLKESTVGALQAVPGMLGPIGVAIAGVIAAAMAPAVAAAIGAGLLLAVGGGFLAAGIAAAITNKRVAKAWEKFGKDAKKTFEKMGKPFEQPMIRAAATFTKALKQAEPTLTRISKSLAPIVDKLAPAIAQMALNMLPGIEAMVKASLPLFETVAKFLPEIGKSISQFFGVIAASGPEANIFLRDMFGFLRVIIPWIGQQIALLIRKYTMLRIAVIAVADWIKKTWAAVVRWWTGTIVPSWTQSLDKVMGFFRRMADSITKAKNQAQAVWQAITNWWTGTIIPAWRRSIDTLTGFFRGIARFVTDTIPSAFRSGVSKAMQWWDGLREAAKKPIVAVVGFVNKGLIGPWNWIVDKLGVGSRINEFAPPFRNGGQVPGRMGLRRKDNMIAQVQSGEFFMPVDRTRQYLPILESMRQGQFPLPKYEDGGIAGLLSGPANWVTSKISGPLQDLKNSVGSNQAGQIMLGMADKGKGLLAEKVKSTVSNMFNFEGSGSFTGHRKGVSVGGLQGPILAALAELTAAFGPAVTLISGLRPGSRTLSGNLSYHAGGRAIDIPAVFAVASYIKARWGPQIKELISPWNSLNMNNGRPHAYSGDVYDQHAGTGRFKGNAHIHFALADGGLVGYSQRTGLRSDSHWDNLGKGTPRNQVNELNINYAPNVPTEEALFRTFQKLELLYG